MLFEDLVEIKAVDNKHFQKVSRLECKSENFSCDIQMDINTSIFEVSEGEKLSLAITGSLNLNNEEGEDHFDQRRDKISLMDEYEYVMHGIVFKYQVIDKKSDIVAACISFGGLLMSITGQSRNVQFQIDSKVYMLLRRV